MRAVVLSLVLSVPILAACGGDDGDGDPGGTGAGAQVFEPLEVPASQHSHGDPTGLEQALLEEIQRARALPAAEGERLVALPEVQNAMSMFGVDAQQVIDDFKTYAAAPPLAFDAKLMESSRFHSQDMADNGFQEHDGSAGEGFSDRIDQAGYEWGYCAENIFAYAESVPYCHAAFLIDWGVPDLGHRRTTLDLDASTRDIGISIIESPASPAVGPLVVTQDFAMPLSDEARYVVGVAYVDADGDGAYDAGEGRPGLTVVVERAQVFAVTGASGGYAIPVDQGHGAARVQVQRDGTVRAEENTTVSSDNVKVDFVLTAAAAGE